jgi:hypothetical protein
MNYFVPRMAKLENDHDVAGLAFGYGMLLRANL